MSRRPPRHAFPSSGEKAAPASRRKSDSRQIWLWGTHPVLAALANPERVRQRLLLTAEAARGNEALLDSLRASDPHLQPEIVERPVIDSLLPPGAVHQGLALKVAPLPALSVEDLVDTARNLDQAVIMVLDQVTDPHNVGAILRSAAAFGAIGVMAPDRNAPDETGTLAKSASGALERLPLVRTTNLVRGLNILKDGGFWIAGLDGEAPKTLAETALSGKVALVLGAEGEGLRRLTRESCDYLVRLPQTSLVESLNVSNAAAVALYELVRR